MHRKIKQIVQIRDYKADFTESTLYVPWREGQIGWVLEDVARPVNVKFDGVTCVPEGCYTVGTRYSPKFKRDMLELYNTVDYRQKDSQGNMIKDSRFIERDGKRFDYVYQHGGNKVKNTLGCLLTNEHTDHKGSMWGSLEAEIFAAVKADMDAGYHYQWIITS